MSEIREITSSSRQSDLIDGRNRPVARWPGGGEVARWWRGSQVGVGPLAVRIKRKGRGRPGEMRTKRWANLARPRHPKPSPASCTLI